ncbi:MAG: hypothetical protein ACLQQ4_17290 [Bacteroidia bacterium]
MKKLSVILTAAVLLTGISSITVAKQDDKNKMQSYTKATTASDAKEKSTIISAPKTATLIPKPGKSGMENDTTRNQKKLPPPPPSNR